MCPYQETGSLQGYLVKTRSYGAGGPNQGPAASHKETWAQTPQGEPPGAEGRGRARVEQ